MPYTPEHRQRTKAQIIESARKMFNRHGYAGVSIDQIMAHAGLSRGGFYHHFKTKEELFAAAVTSFLQQSFAQDDTDAPHSGPLSGPALIQAAMDGYLSPTHLQNTEDQCPIIALPSDVARAGPAVRDSYKAVFEAMLNFFETNLDDSAGEARRHALTLVSLCVGGMVLARTMQDETLSEALMDAARHAPQDLGLSP